MPQSWVRLMLLASYCQTTRPTQPMPGDRRAWWRTGLRVCLVVMVAVGFAACGTDEGAPGDTSSVEASATDVAGDAASRASSPVDGGELLPPETGDDFHLSFDGLDDRVLVPWDASFPTEVFTASAWIRLTDPPNGRAAIIARGEDDDSFNLSWQLYVGREGTLEAMSRRPTRTTTAIRTTTAFPSAPANRAICSWPTERGTTSRSPGTRAEP